MYQFGIGFHTTCQKRRNYEFVFDHETLIKVGNELVWVWVAIELKSKTILRICIAYERNMLIADHFIRSLVKRLRWGR
jgi:putative transposase